LELFALHVPVHVLHASAVLAARASLWQASAALLQQCPPSKPKAVRYNLTTYAWVTMTSLLKPCPQEWQPARLVVLRLPGLQTKLEYVLRLWDV
jgi:hypothetical protein